MSIQPDMTLFDLIVAHAGHRLIGTVKGMRGEEYGASIECLSCEELIVDTEPLHSRVSCSETETRTFSRQPRAMVSWDNTDWNDSLRTLANSFKAVSPAPIKCCERDTDGDGNCDRHRATNDPWVHGYMRWRSTQPEQE